MFKLAVEAILKLVDMVIKNPKSREIYKEKLLLIAAKITEIYGAAAVEEAVNKLNK